MLDIYLTCVDLTHRSKKNKTNIYVAFIICLNLSPDAFLEK